MEGASHANGSSTVRLADGRQVRGSLVLDATGHLRKLVEYDKEFNPGFQGAYGIIAGGQRDWEAGGMATGASAAALLTRGILPFACPDPLSRI